MTTTDTPKKPSRNYGGRMALAYWLTTPHVYYSTGTNAPWCYLCLEPEGTTHLPATPAGPKPVVTTVTDNDATSLGMVRQHGYSATVQVSCGHNYSLAAMPDHWPLVGSETDCSRCWFDRQDADHPGIPEEQYTAIQATLPKCPNEKCGKPIYKIPFVQHVSHSLEINIDRQTGDIDANSDLLDRDYESPDWYDGNTHVLAAPYSGYLTGRVEVECEDDHYWIESRLAWRYAYGNNSHLWLVLPPVETP